MRISKRLICLAACCFCLAAVLPTSVATVAAADEIAAYLAGSGGEPLILSGDIHLGNSVTVTGDKTLITEEGAELFFEGGTVTIPKGCSLTLAGAGRSTLSGGWIINQNVLTVACDFSVDSGISTLTNIGYGSQGWLRITEGGHVTVTGSGSAILCNATNYNASVSVERGGKLTLQNSGGSALEMVDMKAGFATATLRVCDGGTLLIANTGGTAINALGTGGTFFSVEAGGVVIGAGQGTVLAGPDTGIACNEAAAVVYLTEQEIPLPAGAPEPYYGLRFDLGGAPEGWSGEYTIHTHWGRPPIVCYDQTYYPVHRGETPVIASPGYVSADIAIADPPLPGEAYVATLGPPIPEGPKLNTALLMGAGLAVIAAFVLFNMQRGTGEK